MLARSYLIRSRRVLSLAFTSNLEEAAAGTTVTYPSMAIGAPHARRIVVVAIGARMTTANTISSVTIAGIPATLVEGTVAQNGGTNGANSAIYQASVPTGTTADIVVTYGAATSRTGIAVYRLVTINVTATSADQRQTGTTVNGSLTVVQGGAGLVFTYLTSSSAAVTWSGATQDYTAVSGGSSRVSSASVLATSAAINNGVSAGHVLSLAAWSP